MGGDVDDQVFARKSPQCSVRGNCCWREIVVSVIVIVYLEVFGASPGTLDSTARPLGSDPAAHATNLSARDRGGGGG